jgi:hypothetical protein
LLFPVCVIYICENKLYGHSHKEDIYSGVIRMDSVGLAFSLASIHNVLAKLENLFDAHDGVLPARGYTALGLTESFQVMKSIDWIRKLGKHSWSHGRDVVRNEYHGKVLDGS